MQLLFSRNQLESGSYHLNLEGPAEVKEGEKQRDAGST